MLKHWQEHESTQWNDIIARLAKDGGLLQSWEWGRFQESLGNAVYNLSHEEKWYAQCIQLKAGNQWILSIPRGPVTPVAHEKESFKNFLFDLKAFAKDRGCFLVRFDPAFELPLAKELSLKKSARERNPVHTLIMNTSYAEEELLEQMKPKWRYNIRLAQKRGVAIRRSCNPQDATMFASLMQKTTERQSFATYDEEYFTTFMKVFGKNQQAEFFFAEYEGKTIAAILVAYFGKRAYYLHGGSDNAYRQVMAPHLLQWEAIKEARKRSLEYDFWGIAAEPPANKQEAQWAGVTRFKKGFAPQTEATEYMGTYELPVSKLLFVLYRLRQRLTG